MFKNRFRSSRFTRVRLFYLLLLFVFFFAPTRILNRLNDKFRGRNNNNNNDNGNSNTGTRNARIRFLRPGAAELRRLEGAVKVRDDRVLTVF